MVKKSRIGRTKIPPPQNRIEPDGHGDNEQISNNRVEAVHSESKIDKPDGSIGEASDVDFGPRTEHRSLEEFWEKFRLSPVDAEHVIQTNLGWLALMTLGPLLLLVVLRAFAILVESEPGSNFEPAEVFADLGDTIYTPISISLFVSAFIFRYRWYKALPQTFTSLLENEVLRTKEGRKITTAEFVVFLEDYRRKLHSRKRYVLPAMAIIITLVTSLLILTSRGWSMSEVNELSPMVRLIVILHTATRWVAPQILWSFVLSLWFWSLISTAKAIKDLTTRFRIYVQPLHSDLAGGLKKLGDLSSAVGMLIMAAATAAMFVAVRETIYSTRLISCGTEFQQVLDGRSSMTVDRFTDCVYRMDAYYGISRGTTDFRLRSITNDNNLKQGYIRFFYQLEDFQLPEISRSFAIYYMMDLIILVALAMALYAVVWPLADIHYRMAEYKHKRERETNHHISVLLDELTSLVKQGEFEKADKIKANIGFLTNELAVIQKYPTWPFRSLRVVRSYLSSSFITALIAYVFTVFQPILIALLKQLFGVSDE